MARMKITFIQQEVIAHQRPPLSILLQASDSPYHRRIHCVECGLPIAEIVDNVSYIVDNSGEMSATREELQRDVIGGYVEIQCKRSSCHQHYRIYYPKSNR